MSHNSSLEDAFYVLLKDLSLDEFPYGNGNWRNNLKWESDLLETKDSADDVQLFTIESLRDISHKSPFIKKANWSSDLINLQNGIIESSDRKIQEKVCKYFKQLRLVDKKVTHIDESLLKFVNLEELILSANFMTDIPAQYLPASLRVMELCGNQIFDLTNLGVHPPNLQHLGLSDNKICNISHFILPKIWNHLLSLDLSYNYLDDLRETVKTLCHLPKLQSLLLQANPLYFSVAYRGYVIDSIITLTLLDDIRISADERHHFKGFGDIKDLPTDEMAVTIKLDNLKGLLKPEETATLTDDYPKTLIKYHLEFDFISNSVVKDEPEDDSNEINNMGIECDQVLISSDENYTEVHEDSEINNSGAELKNKLTVIRTNDFQWVQEDEIPLHCNKIITSKNLKHFQTYLQKKLRIRLIQNKVLVSNEPKPQVIDQKNLLAAEQTGILKEKSSKSIGRAGSKVSVVTKQDDKSKAKPKQAKKDACELIEWSRTSRDISCCEISLKTFLEDSYMIDDDFIFINTSNPILSNQSVRQEGSAVKKGSSQEIKKKIGKESRRGSMRSIGSIKPPKVKRQDSGVNELLQPTEEKELPDTLSVHFYMELRRWKNNQERIMWLEKYGTKSS